MRTARIPHAHHRDTLPLLPPWVTSTRSEAIEDVAFLSGAALAMLDVVCRQDVVPHSLMRDRLALSAAQACVAFAGRSERASDLRDAVHLLRPGDAPGPAGALYQTWQGAVARPISAAALHGAFANQDPAQIAQWLEAGQGGPLEQAACVLERVLADVPRAEHVALILAEARLAWAMGWPRIVPVLSAHLKARDLKRTGAALRVACHRSVVTGATQAVTLGRDLARRGAQLTAVTPKLRAKGAARAVDLFLTRDAVAPSALRPLMSDRAARRFCDRLVDLGVVRELTGRDTSRLYGV